jgi:hypothetical protein
MRRKAEVENLRLRTYEGYLPGTKDFDDYA